MEHCLPRQRHSAAATTAHPFLSTTNTTTAAATISCASSSSLVLQHHPSGAAAQTSQRILHLLDTCCSSPSRLRQIQAHILLHGLHRSTWVASAFIGACKNLHLIPSALLFFRHIPGNPHVYVCNSLLRALVHPPPPSRAWSWSSTSFVVYAYMLSHAVRPNNYTFPLVLKSLSDLRLPRQGRSVHSHVVSTGHAGDIYVRNSLLNLYSSCGEMNTCQQLFDEMRLRDPVSWTTVIEGYRKAGRLDEALITFERMQISGTAPNQVTMVNALAACAGHAGLVDAGRRIFHRLLDGRYGFAPGIKHYGCMVDMLGRAGLLEEAVKCVEQMPLEPNEVVYGSLLGAQALRDGVSNNNHNRSWSEPAAARKLVELAPHNGAHYVLLSNLYASTGRWNLVEEVRKLMTVRQQANKEPPCWVAGSFLQRGDKILSEGFEVNTPTKTNSSNARSYNRAEPSEGMNFENANDVMTF
ncbi:hypothetical protein Taro_051255 [Colocasia esculenta]|uniref:Pentatricopeptide repeat-containing protein n=1 Tax=Colocasia esculenta TaxID=4460 RepID=A0A843XFH5_COLES|nr:hypothetical protein [Colocasia esculenta]